jgi:hypothetical protein
MKFEKHKSIFNDITDYIYYDNEINASELFIELCEELHKDKQYDIIVKYYNEIRNSLEKHKLFYSFELAYAFSHLNKNNFAEEVYQYLIDTGNGTEAVLNNLSNIKEKNKEYKKAYKLISGAYKRSPKDEIISNNYKRLKKIVEEIKEKEKQFKAAINNLKNENQFVINKLSVFLKNCRKDDEYDKGTIPIPNWKFKALMQTDEQKADSLKKQWIDKKYISSTEKRGDFNELIYEINPYLYSGLKNIEIKKVNKDWISGIEKLNQLTLEKIGYFSNYLRLNKINKTFKNIILRDYDELTLNFILNNFKSTIVIAGSLIESLLIYHLNKKRITEINYAMGNKTINKNLFDCTLNDLLIYCENNKILEKQFVHLGNISRIYRNFIHPGKEVKEAEILDESKAKLCYISVTEIIKGIVK